MADQKVSDLPSLNGADVDAADLLYIVDSSAGAAGSKKITIGQYQLAPVSGGTANTVVYLNGSKVESSSSALTFDGTNFATTGTSSAAKLIPTGGTATGNGMYLPAANTLAWSNNGAETMRLDSSGNLGLGVTPSAWSSAYRALDVFTGGTAFFSGSAFGGVQTNSFVNASSQEIYKTTAAASKYLQVLGEHRFYTAPSGTAGNTISFTQAMTLDASGNLGIGTSSPGAKLHVVGNQFRQNDATNSQGYVINTTSPTTTLATLFGGSSFAVQTGGSGTNQLLLDSSGNLGLGVTPSASVRPTLNIGSRVGLWQVTAGATALGYNVFESAANTLSYRVSDFASWYQQVNGFHAWHTAPSGTAGNAITFTQAMTLDTSGNLGVGTTSPSQRLTVAGSAQLDSSGTFYLNNSDNTNQYYWQNIGATGANNATLILSRTNAGETLRITSGGLFGINGTPPSDSQFYSKNSVSGTFAGTFANYDAGGYGISIGTASTVFAHFYPNAARTGSPVGSITTNGSSTSYVTSSDRRLKENIQPADDAGAVIDAIEVVQHDWKVGGHTRFGVIAQDLNAVAPEAVSEGDDGDEIERTWGVDYSKLVPMLIKEIQTLRARVAALEAK